MLFRNGSYQDAKTKFFEAFKDLDEIGSDRRLVILQYLAIVGMLSKDSIHPWEAPELAPYRNALEVVPMSKLLEAYSNKDPKAFEKIIQGKLYLDYHNFFRNPQNIE